MGSKGKKSIAFLPEVARQFLTESTIHGLGYLVIARNPVVKALWYFFEFRIKKLKKNNFCGTARFFPHSRF